METAEKDTGLGLTDFLSTEAPKAEAEKASPTEEKTQEQKAEIKTEEMKTEAKSEIKEAPKSEVKTEGIKTEEAQKPSFDFESDANPYKKRYADTSQWANKVNQEKAELLKQFEIINKKLDGTYDPEKDQPAQPTMQDVQHNAELLGKVKASRKIAEETYGAENIQKLIYADGAPFRAIENDPYIQARVLAADAPVLEAMKILDEQQFHAKWGDSPREIEQNIRKKAEEEFNLKIEELVNKRISDRLSLKEKQVNGLGDARTAESKGQPTGSPPLTSIFGN